MTVTAQTSDRNSASLLSRYYEVHPTYRLIVRWALIALLTAVAFWRSFFSIGVTAHEDGLGGYVWTVPTAAILVAVGLARRHRTELPIHDRQTDIIVGTMGLVLALLIRAVLLERYALYFHLLRLDLLAAWLFVLSCSIVLFGLRPVSRFAWVWGMMFFVFALPYYLLVIFLGAAGSRPAPRTCSSPVSEPVLRWAVPCDGAWWDRWLLGLWVSPCWARSPCCFPLRHWSSIKRFRR